MKRIRTKQTYSHIRYIWEDETGSPCNLTLHVLDKKLAFHGIPEHARQIPTNYDYERERWIDVKMR